MRNLISVICVILSFCACSLPTTKGLQQVKSTLSEYHNPYFSDVSKDYIYKAKIKAFKSNFGGILIIKKIKNQQHRIVFTTDFGNKIFDFEIIKNSFKTHYLMEQLNKKIVIKTLQRDFETLIKERNSVEKAFKNTEAVIYKSKNKKRFNYYFTDLKAQKLQKIVHTSNTKEKTIFSFENSTKNVANQIKIAHKNLPITIRLIALKSF